MNNIVEIKDLIILVADKNMEFTIKGLLGRKESFGIKEVKYDTYVHPERDPGCLLHGHDFFRQYVNQFTHGLIMLDRQGCGKEEKSRLEIETRIEENLSRSGWSDRAAAIVIDPELEIWVWSDSPYVETILGWKDKQHNLKSWLIEKEFLNNGELKPFKPKEAVEKTLSIAKIPRSSSLYFQLAQKVSFENCIDEAFLKLKRKLQEWFPED